MDRQYSEAAPAVLIGPSGVVPTVLRYMDIETAWNGLPILQPLVSLEPNAEYRVEGLTWGNEPYTFTTGTVVSLEPPAAPIVQSLSWTDEGDSSYECEGESRFQIGLSNSPWLSLYKAVARPALSTVNLTEPRQISWYGGANTMVGPGAYCQAQWYQPGAHDVYVAHLDSAGNLSSWTQIPEPLNWDIAPKAELGSGLPVQGNAPEFEVSPLFRGQSGEGCAIRTAGGRNSGNAAALWILLALLFGMSVRFKVARSSRA